MPKITIATLNIAAASKVRARELLDQWIAPNAYDVYVFTETSEGPGTALLVSEMRSAGWITFQPATTPNDRGIVVATRLRGSASNNLPRNDPAPGRAMAIHLETVPCIEVIGMYVPNRGNDGAKTERKRAYLQCWLDHLRSRPPTPRRILLGDLNVVPAEQRPVFLPQQPFEYDWLRSIERYGYYDAAVRHASGHQSTWVAHTREGYTYDHIFPHEELASRVMSFEYDHSTRGERALSDHSALILSITVDSLERLPVRSITTPTQAHLF